MLERGSVEGQSFHRGAVEVMAPDARDVAGQLMTLVRKDLLRPDRAVFAGEDAFAFRHLLIRDAAYDSLPKANRAELHARFAGWLEQRGQDLEELDEIAGYHLEQAFRYRTELGPADEQTTALGEAAAAHLEAAGRRALDRGDTTAAVNLLERSEQLRPDQAMDVAVLEVARARARDGGETRRGRRALGDRRGRARRSGRLDRRATGSTDRSHLADECRPRRL